MKANLPGVGAEVHVSRQADQDRSGFPLDRGHPGTSRSTGRRGDTGIVLTVDEAQDAAAEELRALRDLPPARRRGQLAGRPARRRPAPLRTGASRALSSVADWFDIGRSPPRHAHRPGRAAVRAGRPYEAGAAERLAAHTGGYPTPYSSTVTLPGASPKASPSSPPAPSTWPSRLPVRSSSATSTASAGNARPPGNASTSSPWLKRSQQQLIPPAPAVAQRLA